MYSTEDMQEDIVLSIPEEDREVFALLCNLQGMSKEQFMYHAFYRALFELKSHYENCDSLGSDH